MTIDNQCLQLQRPGALTGHLCGTRKRKAVSLDDDAWSSDSGPATPQKTGLGCLGDHTLDTIELLRYTSFPLDLHMQDGFGLFLREVLTPLFGQLLPRTIRDIFDSTMQGKAFPEDLQYLLSPEKEIPNEPPSLPTRVFAVPRPPSKAEEQKQAPQKLVEAKVQQRAARQINVAVPRLRKRGRSSAGKKRTPKPSKALLVVRACLPSR